MNILKTTGIIIFIVVLLPLFCLVSGCGESFYDSGKLASAGDHLGHINSKVDLFWTMHQHGFNKTALIGCRPSRLYPGKADTPEAIEEINSVALTLTNANPNLIYALPLVRVDDPNPLKTATRYLVKQKAFGIALDPTPGQNLFSKQMLKLYAACEFARVPIYLHFNKDRFSDLIKLSEDYPNIIFIVAQMAGMHDNLPALDSLLWKNNNIYLGFGFGPEEVLFEKMDKVVLDLPGLIRFIENHKQRICFAMTTNLTEEPYRNSAFAETLVRFMRRFFEKETANIKIKMRDGKWIERQYPGLALNKQILGYIYRFNFDRAYSETRPRVDAYNLDLLVPGMEKGIVFDSKSKLRLIPAVVSNNNRALTGLSTNQLRKLLRGKVTDFDGMQKSSGSLKLVSCGPVAKWLAKLLKVKIDVEIKRIDDPDKFSSYIFNNPGAIGFCTFNDLNAKLRCLNVDGESPIKSYIKYCAAKGAGTYGHYFDTYPLLIPVSIPEKNRRVYFEPHQLRQFIIAGPATFGSIDKNKETYIAAGHPTNDVVPYFRDAGLAILPFKGDIQANCNSDDCTDTDYITGILATGLDSYAGNGVGLTDFFGTNFVKNVAPGSPVIKDVRGLEMTLVGGKASIADLNILIEDIRKAVAKGSIVACAIWAEKTDFEKISFSLLEQGATAVVNIKQTDLLNWILKEEGIIAPGLGASFLPKSKNNVALILALTFYKEKLIGIEPIMVESRNGVTRRLSGVRATDALKILTATIK